MAPSATKHRHDDSDDDDDTSSGPSSTPPSDTPNKRARLAYRTGPPAADDDDELLPSDAEDDENAVITEGNILPEADLDMEEEDILDQHYDIGPDTNVFQPGSLVRIKVKNFVTYSKVEIHMGPSLNMIVGPNGTGKSTIVCAICLGLGWPPATLGRAKEASEFVKHGNNEAYIEIEIQGREGEDNVVITRKIMRENNQSSWTVDGKPSTIKKVQNLVKSYNIQVDNLCQFLPQDRVKEFSNLGPTMKLQETERAAAHPSMLACHKQLIELDKKTRSSGADLEHDKNHLKQLKDRQALLKQDVDRLKEREKLAKEIKLYEKVLPLIIYRDERNSMMEAKAKAKAARQELAALQREMKPAMERPKRKKEYQNRLLQCSKERKEVFTDKQKELTDLKDRIIPTAEAKIKSIKTEMEQENNREIRRRQDIEKLKKDIEKLAKDVEKGPPEIDLAHYNNLISEKNRDLRDLHQQSERIKEEIDPKVQEARHLSNQIGQLKAQLSSLESVAGQKEQLLKNKKSDTFRLWEWIKEHRSLFEKEVYGPPILNCEIKSRNAVDALESLIGSHMFAFTCQTRNDYNLISQRALGKGGLNVRDVTVREYSGTRAPTLAHQRFEHDPNTLRDLGFDGIALDFIEGPDPVKNMLCHEAALHRYPVALREFPGDQNQVVAEKIPMFISGKTQIQMTKRYGVTTTRMNPIHPAKFFGAAAADPEAMHNISLRISELTHNMNEMNGLNEQKNAERNGILEQIKSIKVERADIEAEKSVKQKAVGLYHTRVAEKKSKEEDLRTKQQGGGEYKQRTAALQEKLTAKSGQRAELALKFATLVTELVELHNEYIKVHLRYIEAKSDTEVLEKKNERIIRQEVEKRRQVRELEELYEKQKDRCKRMKAKIENLMAGISPEENQLLQQIPQDYTEDKVHEEIEKINARLLLLTETNPAALKQYEEREEKIKHIEAKIEAAQADYDQDKENMAEIQKEWEPKLDELVKKISTAFSKSFEKIGCAGEVRVRKDPEGFDKWAIDILVKFRDSETLKVLDGHRQSGGERAVSTVFYLMALQSLARSPFRVVDEINQGMDPRNERVVHHRMVNIACQEHTSQYFLITPKLLTNLLYHPRMKVHCIYSGDWVGEGLELKSSNYLEAGRRQKARG